MQKDMPLIDLDLIRPRVSDSDFALIRGIVAERGKNKGRLRASKPDIPVIGTRRSEYGFQVKVNDFDAGCTAYLWRMVAFQVSPLPQHHCMPCTADFDLEEDNHDARRALAKRLDDLVSIVVDSIPPQQWHGVKRWGEAFGMLGTPRRDSSGATIYRLEE